MLDNILGSVQDYVQNAVTNHAGIPANQKSSISQSIINTVGNALTNHVSQGGNLGQLGNLLSGGSNSSFYNNTHSSVVDSLISKAGINSDTAHSIASAVLPGLASAITSKLGANAASGVVGNLLNKAGLA
jgi:hypothetical protein